MNPPGPRAVVSGVTLAVAAVVVAVMAVWGISSATAPIEDDDTSSAATETDAGPGCPTAQQQIKEYLNRREVTVSVYNAGKKAGRAGDTMTMLENAGFTAGAVGNAPDGTSVAKAEVHVKQKDEVAGELVAAAFGGNIKVVVDEDTDLGPGPDVYIGDKFKRLAKNAPDRQKLTEPIITCSKN